MKNIHPDVIPEQGLTFTLVDRTYIIILTVFLYVFREID